MLNPAINTLNAPFWEAARAGRLVLPFCTTTGRAFWPPSPSSPYATGGAVEWRDAEPRGRLCTGVVYRRSFHKAFEALMPYAIGLVELDAGPRLQAHIPNPDSASAPRTGERVALRFTRPFADGEPFLTAQKE
jgi:uncharacterized protein